MESGLSSGDGGCGVSVEIIDFYQPYENAKSIYIPNIPLEFAKENDIFEYLYSRFSEFGLLYDVRIFSSTFDSTGCAPTVPESTEKTRKPEKNSCDNKPQGGCYAFVNFHSHFSASKAKTKLCGRLMWGGQHLKMKFPTKKSSKEKQLLYYKKCFDLANHYLGFNGWSIAIKSMKERKPDDDGSNCTTTTLCYECWVQLNLPRHGLTCFGFGSSFQYWDRKDVGNRGSVVCRAKKQAYQFAIQDAFSRLLIVTTADGKVFPEVDTTADQQHDEMDELLSKVIPIKVRDGEYEISDLTDDENTREVDHKDDEDDAQFGSEMDENNRRILAELEADDWD